MQRNVFTIGPGVPFLATFVESLLNGEIIPSLSRGASNLDLAKAAIYVPTQRAGRALAVEFARALDKPSALLPRILPLGGLDDQEIAGLFETDEGIDDALDPAIDEIDRRLILARLVQQWADALRHAIVSISPSGAPVLDKREPMLVSASPANAYALASELSALIDELIIEDVDASAIRKLADDSFDKYWAITADFLKIALEQWPAILAELRLCDKAARGKALIGAQIARLAQNSSGAPVIALGSTGANPATARLLKAIATAHNGAVVLPGADLDLDEEGWSRTGHAGGAYDEPAHTHPQAVLKRLLSIIGARRDDIVQLGAPTETAKARRALVSQALRPADTTEHWRSFRAAQASAIDRALEHVTFIEGPDERLEALSLALMMRQALETPGRTAALVTPDRDIARRVAAELARFEIEIDDSGGKPLAATPIGSLARLAAQIAQEGLTAVNVASLLAHPLACFGLTRAQIAALAPLIEIAVLRVVGRAEHGWTASCDAARENAEDWRAHPAARRITGAQWADLRDCLELIEDAAAPFAATHHSASLADRARAHRTFIFAAAASGEASRASEGVEELLSLFDKLARAGEPLPFDASAYAALLDRLLFETIIRGPRRAHPRLKILGALEARLIDADLVLLAGLDETIWPPQTDTGAFLNRSMRRQLGLEPPERRIGQSAHDFMMALGAREVVISRAMKRSGSPTVASRFVTRLRALAGDAFEAPRSRGARILAIAAVLDKPSAATAIERPKPCPPIDLRPTQLSVTRIETLRRDPYSIYAERILELTPVAPLGAEMGAREMGTAIHEALAAFIMEQPRGPLSLNARTRLIAIAREKLKLFLDDPAFRSFTWPRIEAGLDHALSFEHERRLLDSAIFVEERGEWTLTLADSSTFRLTARADRIEVDALGAAAVFDYKTGVPPTKAVVGAGFAPQLTLEAAMIETGAFARVGAYSVDSAAYIRLGGAEGGETQWLNWKDKSFAAVVAEHKTQLVTLLSQFRNVETPYVSRPFVAFASRFGDYDHLARVKEWSRGGEEGA